MAKFKVHPGTPKTDPEIARCSDCGGILARWENVYGGKCHLCAGDVYMEKRR